MKKQLKFKKKYLLPGISLLLPVVWFIYQTSTSKMIATNTQFVNEYNIEDVATIDYPCTPDRLEIINNTEQKHTQHICYLDGSNPTTVKPIDSYTINVSVFASPDIYSKEEYKCHFADKGIQEISGFSFQMCHMPVHDSDPTETIIATIELPNKNTRLEFFVTQKTYDEALKKLTEFTSTLKLK